MVDYQSQQEILREQRQMQKMLQQGRRNMHQVISMIHVWAIDPAREELKMSGQASADVKDKMKLFKDQSKSILMISTSEDVEGKKRDPRWLLLKLQNTKDRGEKRPQIREKKHLENLERIEMSETPTGSLKVTFTFDNQKPYTVYCLKSQRPRLIEVLWWTIHTCRYYFKSVPQSHLNRREIENLTMEWSAFLSEEWETGEGPFHRSREKETISGLTGLMSENQRQILRMLQTDLEQREEEKKSKEQSTSYQVEVNISPNEAKTIEAFLVESKLGVEDIHLLEDYLKSQLADMENKNIQALFSEENREVTDIITSNMTEIDGLVREMASWMEKYKDDLDEMRKGVRKIEARNKKLKIQEQNHQRLQEHVERLLNLMRLDSKKQRLLRAPDFREHLNDMLAAAAALNKMMNVRFTAEIEKMKAIKEIRGTHKALAKTFTAEGAKFLSEYFHQLGHSRVAEAKLELASSPHTLKPSALPITPEHSPGLLSSPGFQFNGRPKSRGGQKGSPMPRANDNSAESTAFNLAETAAHANLLKYTNLVSLLMKMDQTQFDSLLDTYTTEFRRVYESKTRNFLARLRKMYPPKERMVDTRMALLPDYQLDQKMIRGQYKRGMSQTKLSDMDSRATSMAELRSDSDHGMGGRYTSSSAAVNSGPRSPPSNAFGPIAESGRRKERVPQSLFAAALDALCPMCRAEQEFLQDFFFAAAEQESSYFSDQKGGVGSGETSLANIAMKGSSGAISISSLIQDSKSGGSPAETPLLREPSSGTSMRFESKLKSMMERMFSMHLPQLENIAKLQHRHDHFQTLRMLIDARRHKEGNTDVPFLAQGLTDIQAKLQIMFNSFVDGEIRWIASQKSNTKKQGVLGPLLKFPSFVDQMESLVEYTGDTPMQMTTTYSKMASGLFSLVKESAEHFQKKKFGRKVLVLIENFYYFWKVFDTRIPRIKALESKVEEAHKLYMENLKAYVCWHIEYELPKLSQFWDELDDKLSNHQQEELQFLVSKQQVMQTMKKTLPPLQRKIQAIYGRVIKHLPDSNNALRGEVLEALRGYFMERFKRFESQVIQCYPGVKELPKSSLEVKKMFQLVFEEERKKSSA
eukprot:CAMPEP_0114521284 /NCGR_PEP_ID=MMETSP0109-20121206/20098_1 /TAXON_ID=29199 /ORGANISM="Chlorarachnion reptans, Strain CCCM449" /LENGTH=1093 /DNA_ID=CAMNT_0001702367 /DNA_START=105 /DNA_END=3386 /DNA_ORIENTATION=+